MGHCRRSYWRRRRCTRRRGGPCGRKLGDLIANQLQLVLGELLGLKDCLEIHQCLQALLADGVERTIGKIDLGSGDETVHIAIEMIQVDVLALIRRWGLVTGLVSRAVVEMKAVSPMWNGPGIGLAGCEPCCVSCCWTTQWEFRLLDRG